MVELDCDLLALAHFYATLFDVFALKDGWEHHQSWQTALAKHCHYRQVTIKAVLLGSGDHATAVVTTNHTWGKPNFFVGFAFAIYNNFRLGGFVVEQKSLDGNACVVNLFGGVLCADFVSNLTAVAINAVANAVDKLVGLALYFHGGQVSQVLVDVYGLATNCATDIRQKVVAGATAKVVDILCEVVAIHVVDKVVNSSVATHQDATIGIGCVDDLLVVIFQNVYKLQCVVWIESGNLLRLFVALFVVGLWVVKNNVFHFVSP